MAKMQLGSMAMFSPRAHVFSGEKLLMVTVHKSSLGKENVNLKFTSQMPFTMDSYNEMQQFIFSKIKF